LDENDPVSVYAEEIVSKIPPLSEDEESELWRHVKSTDKTESELAKRRLIESKLHLVLSIVERHSASGVSMLDLIQEGNLGLLKALDTFAESSESDFTVYAAALIESAIVWSVSTSSVASLELYSRPLRSSEKRPDHSPPDLSA
jgi:RNA polymerase primary sigma factor